ncbi:hypothetical protein K2Z83_21100 [Oscillochloris sp. ZM17-4]|uniref:hypothetical protein n=1 Tax=Oscillochloris sp. ZM17-4 TaxID=2866714 RepID=UPI001C72E060|nr:hypothetical protein [Oscillochloris sp. ZM17-4]MBX0330170.1 hypothetical protein [Oscillochloris sp. ZM17-4]
MQARLVALLLRYDERGFGRMIGARTRQASEQDTLALRRYRDLGAVFVLRDDLFEDILPRIVRRLSFESPRAMVIEEPPARGRVDWGRTIDAAWAERPGETPLLLHTRQQRRTFATPENLLAVLTLLEYQAEVQRLLWDEQITAGSAALQHPLNEISERCDRELAFPQFAGIRGTAQQILTGEDGDPETLEHQVRERLIPGSNSAYEDLLAWRARLHAVRLLRRSPADPDDVLGANPDRDNYLYQIWIFYELADLLRARACLDHIDPRQGQMHIRFRWGEGDDARGYELRHDQGVPIPPARWGAEPLRRHAVPGVRPDFYLWRVSPAAMRVEHHGKLFWREPGVVWDAKYYRERETSAAPSSPVKRMIADLTLLGERHGTLLFAFLAGGATTTSQGRSYRLRPADRDQSIVPDQQVAVQPLCPDTDLHAVQTTLTALLNVAHARLREPRIPRCQGVFLDTLSVAERGALLGRDGEILAPDLVCPKPHIGPWRVDLVNRDAHCCRDGRLCHIISQPGSAPPVRPPRNARELLAELERLFEAGDLDTLDEEAVERVMSRIEALTRRFVEITGALKDLRRYEAKLGDIGLDRTLHLLGATERESLALAIYLRDQLDEVGANDYSASIIHVARVLERELQRRILAVPGVSGADFPHGKPTLGTLGGVYRRNPALWGTITAHLSQVWVSRVDPDDSTFAVSVEQLIMEVEQLVRVRNEAAHTTPIPRDRFRTILRALCDGGPLRVGALNVLLTAWPLS